MENQLVMSHPLVGCWLIKSCSMQGNKNNEESIFDGLKLILNNTGDVTWILKKNDSNCKGIPLLTCENYSIHNTNSDTVIRFGAYAEQIFEFKVEPREPQENVSLSCEGWCTLNCIRYNKVDPEYFPVEEYNFLSAVEEGFFSDITIEAQHRKQFHVHSTILGLLGNDIPWFDQPPPFTGLPEGVVGSIIHWLYTECLPNAMTESIAIQVIDTVKCYPSMSKLVENCECYLKNENLKQQIVDLVCEIHMCTEHIIENFNEPGESLGSNPAKLCLMIKQSAKEVAVALLKVVLLCDLFTKRKTELTKDDKHEIIKFAHSCLPEFIHQLQILLQVSKITFNSMTPSQMLEIAAYLAPEIEHGLEMVSSIIFELKVAFEQMMQTLLPDQSEPPDDVGETIDNYPSESTFRRILKFREYSKLKNSHQKIAFTLMHILQKKECFAEMSQTNKIRSVLRNFEQIIDELPIFLLRLEEINSAVDDRIQWREFKFCFKVATSKVSGILSKVNVHHETFKDVVVKLCSLVQREAFTQGLLSLGLLQSLSPDTLAGLHGEDLEIEKNSHFPRFISQKIGNLKLGSKLMKTPTIFRSELSKAAEKLLESENYSDMIFEIAPSNTNISKPTTPNQTNAESLSASCPSSSLLNPHEEIKESSGSNENIEENESVIIKAHRVIVATRCDWFRRALQSGMKEAIHKKIVIHDTTPVLFRKLLYYLYTGKLNTKLTSSEQLTELVLLGDRYELDALKLACEKALVSKHLDKDNAFYYLNFADRYNAEHLKEACIDFIGSHAELIQSDLFAELSSPLRSDILSEAVYDAQMSHTAKSKIPPSDCTDEEELSFDLSYDCFDDGTNSECSSGEEFFIDRARFSPCLAHLRDVLGPHVPLDLLNRITLAADCDPNRAINFYYCSCQTNPSEDS